MRIEFDSTKGVRPWPNAAWTLPALARCLLACTSRGRIPGRTMTSRFITVGLLDARLVVLVWTPRGEVRRIISMRKANDREKTFYARHLD